MHVVYMDEVLERMFKILTYERVTSVSPDLPFRHQTRCGAVVLFVVLVSLKRLYPTDCGFHRSSYPLRNTSLGAFLA